jgi:hypothetical protein
LKVPVVLAVAGEGIQHVLEGAVGPFSLAIGMGMEGSGHRKLGAKGVEEGFPEMTRELGITIGDDGLWQAMEFEDVVEEEAGHVGSSGSGMGGHEVNHLGESVHKDNNGIEASLGDRELGDEVHGDLFPRGARDGKGLQETSRDLLTCLDPLTRITGLHVMTDVVVHVGPVKERVDGSVCLLNALMSGDGGVMVVMEDLCTEGAFGDAETVLVIAEGTVGGETVMFQERWRDGFVHGEALQGADDGLKFRGSLDLILELGGELVWGEQGRDRIGLEVRAMRDGISHHIELAGKVFDGGLVGLKDLGPTSLAAGKVGLLVEVTEGGVVSENGEGLTF